MNGLAQVIGPLIMYGVGKHTDITLAPWRVMFLICGGLSVAMGGIFLAIIPINPAEAWFFTTEEREFIAERMRRDLEGGDKSTFSLEQFLEAMRDPKAWLMLLFGILLTMVSPVLIVCVEPPVARLAKLTIVEISSHPSSSVVLATIDSTRCCTLHHPEPFRFFLSGSGSRAVPCSRGTESQSAAPSS